MMMKDISLHVMDIAQNSITAGAGNIQIRAAVDRSGDRLDVSVQDDGRGMSEETVKRVVNPFVTSRTTRKVGLGIPFFKAGAEACGGDFELSSQPGKGTFIRAGYRLSHIDRPPLGDMAQTVLTLAVCNPALEFMFQYSVDGKDFCFDTRQVRSALGQDVPLNTPEVYEWMRDYLSEGIQELNGGIDI